MIRPRNGRKLFKGSFDDELTAEEAVRVVHEAGGIEEVARASAKRRKEQT